MNKTRLFERNDPSNKTPLTACDYNSNGNLLAFASGYDWSMGAEAAREYNNNANKIGIHFLPPNQRKK